MAGFLWALIGRGPLHLQQLLIEPDIPKRSMDEKPVTGWKSQEICHGGKAFEQVLDTERLKEVWRIGEFLTAPDVPTRCAVVEWVTQAVNRVHTDGREGYADLALKRHRQAITLLCVAEGALAFDWDVNGHSL